MNSNKVSERDLLNIIKEAIRHPDIQLLDPSLSGRIMVDHVIGRFEKAIDDKGGYDSCPKIVKEGYEALKQLYPLHFKH